MKAVFITDFLEEYDHAYGHPFLTPVGQEFFRCLFQSKWTSTFLPYKEISPMSMLDLWKAEKDFQILSVFGRTSADKVFAPRGSNEKVSSSFSPIKFNNLSHFLLLEHEQALENFFSKLSSLAPNIIIPLGQIPSWALDLPNDLSKSRGYLHQTKFGKALPAQHPRTILAQWSMRPFLCLDLFKARKESEYKEIRTLDREITTLANAEECFAWWQLYAAPADLIAVDIETANGQISEIGFAASPTHALHIPFFYKEKQTYISPYSLEEEIKLWEFVRFALASDKKKVGQNFKYDVYWLTKRGFFVNNWTDDTMLASHCWQPEFEKSLSALGSIFLDEKSWKGIRRQTEKELE